MASYRNNLAKDKAESEREDYIKELEEKLAKSQKKEEAKQKRRRVWAFLKAVGRRAVKTLREFKKTLVEISWAVLTGLFCALVILGVAYGCERIDRMNEKAEENLQKGAAAWKKEQQISGDVECIFERADAVFDSVKGPGTCFVLHPTKAKIQLRCNIHKPACYCDQRYCRR